MKAFVLPGNTTEYGYFIHAIQRTPAMQGRSARQEFPLLYKSSQLYGFKEYPQIWTFGTYRSNLEQMKVHDEAVKLGYDIAEAPKIEESA